MSYYFNEVKSEEEITSSGDTYFIDCPKCGEQVETKEINQMPWGEGDEDEFTCDKCGKKFSIRPEYKFLGFHTYSEYEDLEAK